jgi:hypothetical protein
MLGRRSDSIKNDTALALSGRPWLIHSPVFLILIKAPAVDFGFINSSVPVTGSFWNGYGGRVVRVPATLFF